MSLFKNFAGALGGFLGDLLGLGVSARNGRRGASLGIWDGVGGTSISALGADFKGDMEWEIAAAAEQTRSVASTFRTRESRALLREISSFNDASRIDIAL